MYTMGGTIFTKLLTVLAVIILIASFVFAGQKKNNFFVPPTRSLFTKPLLNDSKTTLELSLVPPSGTVRAGETFSVSVNANTQTEILVVDLYLKYDPKNLTFISIQPGDIFTNPLLFKTTIDRQTGSIFYALGSITPSRLEGAVATIVFQAKNPSTTTLAIDDDTLASLKGAQKASINIQGRNTYTIE